MDKLVYTIKETAEILRVNRATISNLIKSGKLRALSPSERRYIVPADAIEEYLRGKLN